MKTFFERYKTADAKVQRAVALLPWSHNVLILSKDLNDEDTWYYAHESTEKGWSRDLLLNAIKLKMHESNLPTPADNNFASSLPRATESGT